MGDNRNNNEDCALIGYANGSWEDVSCSATHVFFCRKIVDDLEYISERKTFKDAEKFCFERHKVLAFPVSKGENNDMYAITNKATWIGATDEKNEGVFVHWNGREIEWTNWGGSQPDNRNNNEDCALIGYANGSWEDVSCSATHVFFCQK